MEKDLARSEEKFNYIATFQARDEDLLSEHIGKRSRGRPKKKQDLKPIACFDKDPSKPAQNAFDRETGSPVSPDKLKSCAEALRGYHLSPEAKFLNGEPFDYGRTERRHVVATKLHFIGKESNRWEEAELFKLHSQVLYGRAVSECAR